MVMLSFSFRFAAVFTDALRGLYICFILDVLTCGLELAFRARPKRRDIPMQKALHVSY